MYLWEGYDLSTKYSSRAQSKEVEEPIPTLVLNQHVNENLRIRDKEVDHPRVRLRSEHSLRGVRQATCTRKQNTKEDGRDVQAKKKEKYPNKVIITSTFNALYQLSWPH